MKCKTCGKKIKTEEDDKILLCCGDSHIMESELENINRNEFYDGSNIEFNEKNLENQEVMLKL